MTSFDVYTELKRLKSVQYPYMYTVMTDIHITMIS